MAVELKEAPTGIKPGRLSVLMPHQQKALKEQLSLEQQSAVNFLSDKELRVLGTFLFRRETAEEDRKKYQGYNELKVTSGIEGYLKLAAARQAKAEADGLSDQTVRDSVKEHELEAAKRANDAIAKKPVDDSAMFELRLRKDPAFSKGKAELLKMLTPEQREDIKFLTGASEKQQYALESLLDRKAAAAKPNAVTFPGYDPASIDARIDKILDMAKSLKEMDAIRNDSGQLLKEAARDQTPKTVGQELGPDAPQIAQV